MIRHRRVRLLLYDHVRGLLDVDDARAVERHLAACEDCAREAASHRELLDAVPGPSRRPSDSLPESYWTGFANEVMGSIGDTPAETRGIAGRSFADPGAGRGPLGLPALTVAARRALAALAAAVALGATIWIAVLLSGSDRGIKDAPLRGDGRSDAAVAESVEANGGAEPPAGSAAGLSADFDARLADYFRRSKTLLVGVSNTDQQDGGGVDLDAERQLSRSLLREGRYLRSGPVDPGSYRLIDDLDRILIGLANGNQASPGPVIEMVRGGIRSDNLLFKLRMQETRDRGLPVEQASYQR